jgi:glycosyltransferase involved in cell wall biosynthesis
VDHGQTGYLFPLREPTVLSARIADLLTDAQRRDQMGQAAAAAAKNYSWSKITDRLLETFTMLGSRPRRLT